jgi:hypothetical protein
MFVVCGVQCDCRASVCERVPWPCACVLSCYAPVCAICAHACTACAPCVICDLSLRRARATGLPLFFSTNALFHVFPLCVSHHSHPVLAHAFHSSALEIGRDESPTA